MKIDVLVDLKNSLGECPISDLRSGKLFWIDVLEGKVFSSDFNGNGIRAWEVGKKIGSMCLNIDARYLTLALEDGIYNLELNNGDLHLLRKIEEPKHNRLNDGRVDRNGNFIFGSMDMQEANTSGNLYAYTYDDKLFKLDEGIICSNGISFNLSGDLLYFTDSGTGAGVTYCYDDKKCSVSDKKNFFDFNFFAEGAGDGATVDEEGYIWHALVYGGKIVRLSPEGEIDRIIDFPVKKLTALAFGGPELNTLYVTSMAKPPLPKFPGDNQLRGSLFAVHGLGVRGIPDRRFGDKRK